MIENEKHKAHIFDHGHRMWLQNDRRQDMIRFHVGGGDFTVSKQSLEAVPDGLLNRMMEMSKLSQRHPWGLPTLADGSYFIDRDPKMFKYVLNYLRNKQLPVVPEGRDNSTLILLRKLRLAFEYFMLTGFEFEEGGEAPPASPHARSVRAGQ